MVMNRVPETVDDTGADGAEVTIGAAPDAAERRRYAVTPKVREQRRVAGRQPKKFKSAETRAKRGANALTHGMTAFETSILVAGEDPAAYEELHQALRRQHPPRDPVGDYAVRELANALWRATRRINLAEAALIMRGRACSSFADRMIGGLPAPLPGEQGPHAHLLRTAAGVAKVLEWVAITVEDFPSNISETDEQYWERFRHNAQALAGVVPEFAKFVQAEPSDEVLAGWRKAAAHASMRLGARETWLRAHEETRAATSADTSLVPSGDEMRLLIRYASMNDRKIERLLKMIEVHCGQATDGDDA
jgi:hypothetical protein